MRLFVTAASALLLLVSPGCDMPEDPPPPCEPDADEPADQNQSVGIGTIQDDPSDFSSNDTPQRLRIGKSLHDDADVDLLTVMVQDTGLGGNPKVTVVLSKGFKGTIRPSCTNGSTDNVRCNTGEPTPGGCLTAFVGDNAPQTTFDVECGGTPTDSLAVSIKVERDGAAPGCQRYGVSVSAD